MFWNAHRTRRVSHLIGFCCLILLTLVELRSQDAQSSPQPIGLPPLPPAAPVTPTLRPRPTSAVSVPSSPIPNPNPNSNRSLNTNPPAVGAVLGTTPPFAWDSDFKEMTAKPGDPTAYLSFSLTNVSQQPVTIRAVRPSCGCTLADIPPVPWVINPGSNGVIKTTVDLRGKRQMVSKSITVETSHGYKVLTFRVAIPEPTLTPTGGVMDRSRNTEIAKADRQAVFRGECAKCHVEPTLGKTGAALFTAACGICHEGEHRAAFVPDLRQLKVAIGPTYWKHWITNGKPDSLMPAFSATYGGPLSEAQILSLVDYLSTTIKSAGNTSTPPPAQTK